MKPTRTYLPVSGLPAVLAVVLCAVPAAAQLPSPSDRIDQLERELERLRKELRAVREGHEELADDVDRGKIRAEEIELIGGLHLEIGGKTELRFFDPENGSFPGLGSTREPDPHVDIQEIRVEPEIEVNDEISFHGQIDLEPLEGETVLKEAYLRHEVGPVWWFESRFQAGLDDRFMKPGRRTETYPLLGNAFWRDESMAFIWRLDFGDPDGAPVEEDGGRDPGADDLGTEGSDPSPGGEPAEAGPFDFVRNWGQFRLYLSLGQGYALNTNEVAFDEAAFNSLVQDDRELEDDLSLRELGGGLFYSRDFREYGEVEVGGFIFDDELRDESVLFLQQELTLRDPGGVPLAGYGDSTDRDSERYGATLEYFLPASSLYGELVDTRGGDGLRVLAQAIRGLDGELVREGWFAQASFRVSFGNLLLDRYFRSLEPLVRYGRLQVNLPAAPQLPGTWDREELVVGGILEVTEDMFFKVEYAMHDEATGAGPVDNDEMFAELLIRF